VSVGVVPAEALADRRRLFGALERVFPVRFAGWSQDAAHDLRGIVAFSPPRRPLPPGVPLLVVSGSGGTAPSVAPVDLARADPVGPFFG